MADSTVSIWFDLVLSTGTGDQLSADGQRGLTVTKAPIGSIIVRNVYIGDYEKGAGKSQPMGLWEWIPKCIGEAEKICSYPLPEYWKKIVTGGWHWEFEAYWKKRAFLALSKNASKGKKIGAIADFNVEDFRGYDPKVVKARPIATYGHWVINDGQLNLSGTWQFVNLIFN